MNWYNIFSLFNRRKENIIYCDNCRRDINDNKLIVDFTTKLAYHMQCSDDGIIRNKKHSHYFISNNPQKVSYESALDMLADGLLKQSEKRFLKRINERLERRL